MAEFNPKRTIKKGPGALPSRRHCQKPYTVLDVSRLPKLQRPEGAAFRPSEIQTHRRSVPALTIQLPPRTSARTREPPPRHRRPLGGHHYPSRGIWRYKPTAEPISKSENHNKRCRQPSKQPQHDNYRWRTEHNR